MAKPEETAAEVVGQLEEKVAPIVQKMERDFFSSAQEILGASALHYILTIALVFWIIYLSRSLHRPIGGQVRLLLKKHLPNKSKRFINNAGR